MKLKLLFSFFILQFVFLSCGSGDAGTKIENVRDVKEGEKAEISFREYEHDFGKISEGEKVAHIFVFDNKGPGRLIINSASTSCGCTVTRFDKKPILPQGNGSLEVVFDSGGKSGMQTKTISVRSNSKQEVVILKITAEVIK